MRTVKIQRTETMRLSSEVKLTRYLLHVTQSRQQLYQIILHFIISGNESTVASELAYEISESCIAYPHAESTHNSKYQFKVNSFTSTSVAKIKRKCNKRI